MHGQFQTAQQRQAQCMLGRIRSSQPTASSNDADSTKKSSAYQAPLKFGEYAINATNPRPLRTRKSSHISQKRRERSNRRWAAMNNPKRRIVNQAGARIFAFQPRSAARKIELTNSSPTTA